MEKMDLQREKVMWGREIPFKEEFSAFFGPEK
jgi:hypothetical protein